MVDFQQRKDSDPQLYIEDTDSDLPAQINPKTRYAFFSTIATGGKSLIKSCKDLHLNRTICYKTLRTEFLDDAIEQKRLLREARISANLQHPNTLPTYEIGRTNRGHYYFTMKLVHGYTLREIINYRERYDLTQLIEVIIQVGNALAYAHDKGVLHRDIKPDNILVGQYGETLLLDWGLAKVWKRDASGANSSVASSIDSELDASSAPSTLTPSKDAKLSYKGMTGEAKLQGTLMYMSPEQINRDPEISFAADIYSLGALLYETLTGVTPFQGDHVQTLIQQIKDTRPKKPEDICKINIPEPLSNLAMQCLQKAPEDRPESMAAMLRILKGGW